MNTLKKTILVLSLVTVSVFAFSFVQPAHAQSAVDMMIANLRQQIAMLEQEIANLQHNNQPVAWCYTFNRNLGVGSSGMAVVNLQIALNREGLYGNSQTGMFDEQLASAVVAFQEKYASTVLTPNGLTHGTGYVGPSTRAKLNALYGCNVVINNNTDIIISDVSGPQALNVNQTGTWTINASDSDDTLSYSVNWGDTVSPLTGKVANPLVQTVTFTHSYSVAGNYTITFSVTDNEGNMATGTKIVSVGQAVTAPTANSQSIAVNENSSVNIALTGSDPQGLALTYVLMSSTTHGTLSGLAPSLTYMPNTNFTGTDSFTFKVNNGTYDSNTATVTITVGPVTSSNDLVVNGVSGPVNLVTNQTGTWTINATDLDDTISYSVNWGDQVPASAAANSAFSALVQTTTFTHSYSAAGNYTITFNMRDNEGNTATSTISVLVNNASYGY
jgi:hypothetical protein